MDRIRGFITKHIRVVFAIAVAVFIIAAFVLVRLLVGNMQYRGTEVVAEKDNTGESLSHYTILSEKVIRYSADGVSMLDGNLGRSWNQGHTLNNPVAVTENGYVLLFDKQGTGAELFNTKGAVAGFQTDMPIVGGAVSENGNTALMLDDGTNSIVRYYTKDGALIADIAGGWDELGYPVAVDISSDGYYMGITYLRANEEGITSELCVYSFSNESHDNGENLIYRETFQGEVLPCVTANSRSMAVICEDGFYVYKLGREIRKEAEVTFEEDIISAFYDDTYLGFVFRSPEEDTRYEIKVYNLAGSEKSSIPLNMIYSKIAFMSGDIVAYNASEMEVTSVNGKKKFTGVFAAGGVEEIHKISRNRYLTVTSRKTEIVQLKLLDSRKS